MKGFMLQEVLVSLAIFGLFVSVVTAVTILSHSYSRQGQRVSLAEREAVKCVARMTLDLQCACAETWHSDDADSALWFVSWRAPSRVGGEVTYDNGEPKLRQWTAFQLIGSEVRRGELPLLPEKTLADLASSYTPFQLADFSMSSNSTPVADHVTQLSCSRDARRCVVHLVTQTHNPGNPPTRYELNASVLMP